MTSRWSESLTRFWPWLSSHYHRIVAKLQPVFSISRPCIPLFTILNFYLFIEVAFYLYYRNQKQFLQWHTKNFLPPFPKHERDLLWRRMLAVVGTKEQVARKERVVDWQSFLSGWFFGCDSNEIQRGNIVQFIAYAFFHTYPNMLTSVEREETIARLTELQDSIGFVFPRGLNPNVKAIRLILDPLQAIHRPLIVYGVIGFLNWLSRFFLVYSMGFRRCELGGFRYWYRPIDTKPANGAESPPPLVFMHGLGQGLLTYIHFIARIKDRPVFLIEFPYVSMKVWEHVPTPSETVDAVETLLFQHNFSRAAFMGHSFGTFCVSWCIKFRPRMVHSAVVIDPVSLLLFLPTTAYSFMYAPPQTFIQAFIRFIATRELGIARFMARNFCWHSNILSLEDTILHPETNPPRVGCFPVDHCASDPGSGLSPTAGPASYSAMCQELARSKDDLSPLALSPKRSRSPTGFSCSTQLPPSIMSSSAPAMNGTSSSRSSLVKSSSNPGPISSSVSNGTCTPISPTFSDGPSPVDLQSPQVIHRHQRHKMEASSRSSSAPHSSPIVSEAASDDALRTNGSRPQKRPWVDVPANATVHAHTESNTSQPIPTLSLPAFRSPPHSSSLRVSMPDGLRDYANSDALSPLSPIAVSPSRIRRQVIPLGIFLSGADPFVPSEAIARHAEMYQYPHVSVVMQPNLGHAQFIFSSVAMTKIVNLLQSLD